MDAAGGPGAVLWIISGPTSVGKSAFLVDRRCAEITGLPPETPVVFPFTRLRPDQPAKIASGAFYHYNILRPRLLLRRRRRLEKQGAARTTGGARSVDGAEDFRGDPGWGAVASLETEKRAIVLVADRETLLRRVEERKAFEDLADVDPGRRYDAGQWLRLYRATDLVSLYQAWCDELRASGIPYLMLDSRSDSYPELEDEEAMMAVLDAGAGRGRRGEYGKAEIEEILQERKFEYHRIELPHGLATEGRDRKETLDLIFPPSLEGESVLDVGSALGYFCFEAEARGAERVVGVELKASRYRDALLLKDIKGSNVEFLRRDVLVDPVEESFDHVLLLNVIHHLAEPARAMRQLARITRKRMVIEFPTFSDKKFRKTARFGPAWLYNRLPVIGVSSAVREQQTFVFAPPAIRRMLTDHERLFERVEILPSPVRGRAIAICHK